MTRDLFLCPVTWAQLDISRSNEGGQTYIVLILPVFALVDCIAESGPGGHSLDLQPTEVSLGCSEGHGQSCGTCKGQAVEVISRSSKQQTDNSYQIKYILELTFLLSIFPHNC